MNNSKFIVVDGTDGAGKSSNIAALASHVENKYGTEVVLTREPGGTLLAEQIRDIALRIHEEVVHPETELLLMFAARAQHIENRIKPALAEGKWVISDRFTSSTIAYQGYARGFSMDHINQLTAMVQGRFRPDLTLLLDVDPEIGRSRVGKRGDADRMEKEDIQFFQKAREGFRAQAASDPERFRVVDANDSMEIVTSRFIDAFDDWSESFQSISEMTA